MKRERNGVTSSEYDSILTVLQGTKKVKKISFAQFVKQTTIKQFENISGQNEERR